MIRIRTASRLHFGLIDPAGVSGRRYGGVGLMVEDPGIELVLDPAPRWQIPELYRPRLEGVFRSVAADFGREVPPMRLDVVRATTWHVGLGTGTQLGLAFARGLAEVLDLPDRSAVALARLAGRGTRSSIGIHGFDQGGFLVDGGKTEEKTIAPLAARLEFPTEWPILLIESHGGHAMHGEMEKQVMAGIGGDRRLTGELHALALRELIPRLRNRDWRTFSDQLALFNRMAGAPFANVQGGPYRNPETAYLAGRLAAEEGVVCVGQSSWGPTLFALSQDLDQAERLRRRLEAAPGRPFGRVLITRASNRGASVTRG